MSEAAKIGWSRSLILGGAALSLAVAAGLYLIAGEARKPPPAETAASAPAAGIMRNLATGALAAFVVKPLRKAVPDIAFEDGTGKPLHLSQWRGRVALVNLWATWCAPCREEMPSLAALQTRLGSKDFEVVAISLDRKGAEVAGAFLSATGATALKLYIDETADALDKLQAIGLPATILVDRKGNEIGRMLGPADWSGPEAVALIEAALAEK